MHIDNKGSALAWVLMLLIVSSILLLCLLPMGVSSIQGSRQKNNKQQAYYTAKSVADMVVSYIVSDTWEKQAQENTPGYQIIEKATTAGITEGYTWQVEGLNEEKKSDMGSCEVNVRYDGQLLYVTAKAVYGEETSSIRVKLQQEDVSSEYSVAADYITGAYPGIRVNHIKSKVSEPENSEQDGKPGQITITDDSRLLVLDKNQGSGTEDAAQSAKYDLKVKPFSQVSVVNVSKIANKIWKLDHRGNEKSVLVYQFQNNFSLNQLILDSYGDTYVWIGEDTTLSIDDIATNSYYSNLFFVLDKNATLKLNEEGETKEMRIWVCSMEKNNGAKVELGDSLHLNGMVDVDEIITGSNVSFSYSPAYGMSGSYKKAESVWKVAGYESGEGGGTNGQ